MSTTVARSIHIVTRSVESADSDVSTVPEDSLGMEGSPGPEDSTPAEAVAGVRRRPFVAMAAPTFTPAKRMR